MCSWGSTIVKTLKWSTDRKSLATSALFDNTETVLQGPQDLVETEKLITNKHIKMQKRLFQLNYDLRTSQMDQLFLYSSAD